MTGLGLWLEPAGDRLAGLAGLAGLAELAGLAGKAGPALASSQVTPAIVSNPVNSPMIDADV